MPRGRHRAVLREATLLLREEEAATGGSFLLPPPRVETGVQRGQVADLRQKRQKKLPFVPMDHLGKKDGGTAVDVSCVSDGVPVYRTEATVADLLQTLDLTTRSRQAGWSPQ